MLSSLALLVVLTVLVMIIHVGNIATAIWVVKCHENDFTTEKMSGIFNLFNLNSLRILFIAFAILISVWTMLICAQNIITLEALAPERVELAIRSYMLRLAESVMIFNYHVLMILEWRNKNTIEVN